MPTTCSSSGDIENALDPHFKKASLILSCSPDGVPSSVLIGLGRPSASVGPVSLILDSAFDHPQRGHGVRVRPTCRADPRRRAVPRDDRRDIRPGHESARAVKQCLSSPKPFLSLRCYSTPTPRFSARAVQRLVCGGQSHDSGVRCSHDRVCHHTRVR